MTGEERARREREAAADLAREFPEWEWGGMFDGFRAVPRGTAVVESHTLWGLLGKLRKRRDGSADAG
jgi:hypothetical protein